MCGKQRTCSTPFGRRRLHDRREAHCKLRETSEFLLNSTMRKVGMEVAVALCCERSGQCETSANQAASSEIKLATKTLIVARCSLVEQSESYWLLDTSPHTSWHTPLCNLPDGATQKIDRSPPPLFWWLLLLLTRCIALHSARILSSCRSKRRPCSTLYWTSNQVRAAISVLVADTLLHADAGEQKRNDNGNEET